MVGSKIAQNQFTFKFKIDGKVAIVSIHKMSHVVAI